MESENGVNRRLIEKYAEAVSLARLGDLVAKSPHLAGLFVASVTESYLKSSRKVMIVGKETRRWGEDGLKEVSEFPDTTAYIDHLVRRHASVLRKPPPRSKFFQFYRHASMGIVDKIHRKTDAVVWANLFCLSHRAGSPVACIDSFEEIMQLSRTLLCIQVEVLRPDVILFVTGTGYDKYIKKFFEISDSERLAPRALWSFKVDGVQAYRTSHPQWEKGREYRERALALAMRVPNDSTEVLAA